MAHRPDGGRARRRDGELERCGCHSRRVASACERAWGGRRATGRPGASMLLSHVNSRPPSPLSACPSPGSAEPAPSPCPQGGDALRTRLSLRPAPAGTSVLLALKPRVPPTAQGWGF